LKTGDYVHNFAEFIAEKQDDETETDQNVHLGGFRLADVSILEGTDISFVGPVAKQILHNWSIAPKQPQPTMQHSLKMAPQMPGPGGMGGGRGGGMPGGRPGSPYGNGAYGGQQGSQQGGSANSPKIGLVKSVEPQE